MFFSYDTPSMGCFLNTTLILTQRNDPSKLSSNRQTSDESRMVTIKLKNVTASQLSKHLRSYARNNPLYKAIKEFGRIIKSMFILLTYYDDVKLRQRIEKQLNRI
jgi:TnpA family transposase